MGKYKVVEPFATGSRDRLGRGKRVRHEVGDIVDLDDGVAQLMARKVAPYREPPKRQPQQKRQPIQRPQLKRPEPKLPEPRPEAPPAEVAPGGDQ